MWIRVGALVAVVGAMAISANAEGDEVIELKSFEAADVVYVVHEGPAWGLGKAFVRVHEVMTRQGRSGPMLARYVGVLGEGAAASGASSVTQVGFFVEGTGAPERGFRRETVPASEAATQTVAGSFGVSGTLYHSMVAWAESRGYRPTGDVIEVYPPKGEGPATVEIRIPVERCGAVVEEAVVPDPRSVEQMVTDEDYAALGAAVLPRRISLERPAWVNDVADRLRIIREIVRKKYGHRGGDVFKMLGAVVERADKVLAGGGTSRASPPAKNSPTTEQIKQRQREVLADLDRILVRAHLKILQTPELREQVMGVLEEIRSIAAGPAIPRRPAERARAVEERGESGDE